MVAPPATGPGPSHTAATRSMSNGRPNGSIPQLGTPAFPYSARREPRRLDMNSVERRGHPSAQDPAPRRRPYDLLEAPTYHPTEAQFRDPMEYIRSIADKASKYGICKIVPPDNWEPGFAIDTQKFHFRTRKQEINLVEGSNRTNLNYLDQLAKFHKQYGTHLNRFPSVDKRPLDLYKLKKAVEVRGGFQNVCKDKKWAEIGRDLGYSGKIMSSLSTSLKNSYQRWLHPYEEWLKYTKNGGLPQPTDPEYANGVGFSPAPPSQHQSPMPGVHPPQSAPPAFATASPAVQASMALQTSIDSPRQPATLPSPSPAAVVRPVSSSGFTAVNSGFAAVNTPSGFTAVNQTAPNASPAIVKAEPSVAHPNGFSGFASVNGTPNLPTTHTLPNGSPLANGNAGSHLKRTLSQEESARESSSEAANGEGDGVNGRRSKRPKRQDFPLPLIHAAQVRQTTPQPRSRSGTRRRGERCEKCGLSNDPPNILVCETCEAEYHRGCLDPPLQSVPEYEWHCSKCLVGNNEYGFEEGNVYSLKSFQDKANAFKDSYFANKLAQMSNSGLPHCPSEDDVEREFWRLVEDITESVEVEYGADIHSTTHGSGFPTIEKDPLNRYSRDAWNLNVLPFHPESLFRHIKGDISGMTVPWLYVGMCFSTFCWHNEDHYAYSANYQHFGATKTWYGIPGSDALAFEAAMRKAVPELFESQPDLLFQLVTILPPDQLRKAGVNVYALDQRAGQFVITFPQAYHAGFNHGFNFNEAVNFAPADWESYGDAGVQRLKEFHKNPCFSHDELLFTAAASDGTISTAKWLAPALERVRDRELLQRDEFAARHKQLSPHNDCTFDTLDEEPAEDCGLRIIIQNDELEEEEYQCIYCKAFCYLSQFRCEKTGRVGCLQHIESIDCCDVAPELRSKDKNHVAVVRFTNHELQQVVQKVVNKAKVPEVWEAKLEQALDGDAKPPLKTLQALLAEGEKIDAPLKGLDDLADFVKRCNAWVEEASVYVTRKQQNRRKNEKAWRRSSTRVGKNEEKEVEPLMTLERMRELIESGEQLSFSAPQIEHLQEKLVSINDWRESIDKIFNHRELKNAEELEALLDEGRGFGIVMPELTNLDELHQRAEWSAQVERTQQDMLNHTLDECKDLLEKAGEVGIDPGHHQIEQLQEMVRKGDFWEAKAKEIMAAEDVHYPQLEALFNQVQTQQFPVNKDTLSQMDAILAKNREAKRQIVILVEKAHDPDFRKRPAYAHVREVMKSLEDLNGKPHGAADLDKEMKRHEDWMRKGKKLFGKANAPLHILEQHMKFVEERNSFCFDLNDTFRPPVEPASREASPVEGHEKPLGLNDEEKPVFCLCRQPEAGLMIECEICHDWYHAKCLKLARGKVKETEMFTCPICDWRVKIPRDAARPKLDDLQAWADELLTLPFQPEEEELLNRIVDKAQAFRDFLGRYLNGNQLCRTNEEMPEMLFYLRKLEGAEVLLAYETNIFRQELHKWQPIAPEPPPILEQSLSTRKPRPTKQQKLMKEHGVERPEDLPAHLRAKSYIRRRTTESIPTGTLMPKPAGDSPSIGGSNESPSQAPGQLPSDSTPGQVKPSAFGNAYPTNASTPFATAFATERTPSPMFSPTGERPPEMRDPMATVLTGSRKGEIALFSNHTDDAEDDLRAGLAGTPTSADNAPNNEEDEPAGDYPDFFREMTNGGDEDGAADERPAPEPEASQATEALEIMRDASEAKSPEKESGEEAGLGIDLMEA